MTLNFSDGVAIDTGGELRPHKQEDGWYVIGRGMMIPVRTYEAAKDLVQSIKDTIEPPPYQVEMDRNQDVIAIGSRNPKDILKKDLIEIIGKQDIIIQDQRADIKIKTERIEILRKMLGERDD